MPEKHVAIIAARAGSKSIKDKNLLKVGDKTLIRNAVDVAFESRIFSKIVVTTDYNRHHIGIDGIPSSFSTKLMFVRRPEELAQDNTLMIEVVKHALKNIGGIETWVWLLQPTSPFRTINDIKKIEQMIRTGKYESLISYCPKSEHPNRASTWKNGKMHPMRFYNFQNKQELKDVWDRSGNFYVCKRHYIEEFDGDPIKWSWHVQPSGDYIMGNINPDNYSGKDKEYSRMLGSNIDCMEDWRTIKGHLTRGDFLVR